MDIVTTIMSAAKTVGVSGNLLLAICSHESGGFKYNYTHMDHGSPSFGFCQVKYDTAVSMGFKGKPDDLNKPYTNSLWAARYLKYQLSTYDNNTVMAVAAYNSGTYHPSNKVLGCPRNLGYIKRVQSRLPFFLKDQLNCGSYRVSFEDNN
jgi:soluble lytic murein transglycosylase-like protein